MQLTHFLKKTVTLSAIVASILPQASMAIIAPPTTTEATLCKLATPGYTTTRLTQTPSSQEGMVIAFNQGNAVWMEYPANGGGGYGKVILFDGVNKRTLSEQATALSASSPDKIVWNERTSPGSNRLDVFFFNGRSVTRLTSPDNDLTNHSPTIDNQGRVAWIRSISELRVESSTTAPPRVIFGESRVMLYENGSTRAISAAGEYNKPQFFNTRLTWTGIENTRRHQNSQEDRRSVFSWMNNNLNTHELTDANINDTLPFITESGVFYATNRSDNNNMLRYYDIANDTTKDITPYTDAFDIQAYAKGEMIGWEKWSRLANSSYLWTGSEVRRLESLFPERRVYVKDIHSDRNQVFLRVEQFRPNDTTNGLSTISSQIYLYNTRTNSASQITDAPAPFINEKATGASEPVFGKGGDFYWSVATAESNYRTVDLCFAKRSVNTENPTTNSSAATPNSSSSSLNTPSTNTAQGEMLSAYEAANCEEAINSLEAEGHFNLPASWKRINVTAGRFSVEMPHNNGWMYQSRALLPYTPYTSGIRISPLTNASLTQGGAIHFGTYNFDLCDEQMPATSSETLRTTREYILTWESNTIRSILRRTTFAETPLSFKLGNDQIVIAKELNPRNSCPVDAPQEILYIQKGNRVYGIGTLCKPIGSNHFRIAASLR